MIKIALAVIVTVRVEVIDNTRGNMCTTWINRCSRFSAGTHARIMTSIRLQNACTLHNR